MAGRARPRGPRPPCWRPAPRRAWARSKKATPSRISRTRRSAAGFRSPPPCCRSSITGSQDQPARHAGLYRLHRRGHLSAAGRRGGGGGGRLGGRRGGRHRDRLGVLRRVSACRASCSSTRWTARTPASPELMEIGAAPESGRRTSCRCSSRGERSTTCEGVIDLIGHAGPPGRRGGRRAHPGRSTVGRRRGARGGGRGGGRGRRRPAGEVPRRRGAVARGDRPRLPPGRPRPAHRPGVRLRRDRRDRDPRPCWRRSWI